MTTKTKGPNDSAKPLTEAQRNHLAALNSAFMQAKQRMDEFVAYLRAEHDAPAGRWLLRNLQVGFERIPERPKREEKQADEAKD